MRTIIRTAVVLSTLALAAACSAPPNASAPPPPAPKAAGTSGTVAAATATPAGATARGNIAMEVGDQASWSADDGETDLRFTVTGITVDPQCPARFATPGERGHLVRVDLDVETMPGMRQGLFSFGPLSWSIVGPDGITETGLMSAASFSCLEQRDQLPSVLTPGSRYRGGIVLDTANSAGVLVFRQPIVDQGWEWPLG